MKIIYDQPKTQGQANVLKRARQLVEFTFTPVEQFPVNYIFRQKGAPTFYVHNTWHTAYKPIHGVPYSSVRLHEKYVGYNVSFETFYTAAQNPNSVLYTKSQQGIGKGMAAFYGTVCSGFASYACELPSRWQCSRWPKLPGIQKVDTSETLDGLQLCDLVLCATTHIAIITGIGRDEEGHVRRIQVSEEVEPSCICNEYTDENFRPRWLENPREHYEIYRWPGIENVTYTPSPYVPLEGDPELEMPPINRAFMTDYGDKANFQKGDTVPFSVFQPEWETIAVTLPDGTEQLLEIQDGKAAMKCLLPGHYTACCKAGDRESQCVQWIVTDLKLQAESTIVAPKQALRFTLSSTANDPVVAYILQTETWNIKDQCFLECDANGILETKPAKPGTYTAFVLAKNEYGLYRSTLAPIIVEEK